MSTRTFGRPGAIVPLLLVAALTACAGGDDDDADGVASLDAPSAESPPGTDGDASTATTEPVDREQALLDFAACMREHGVDMPDPELHEDGGVTFEMSEPGTGVAEGSEEAFEACSDKMPRGPITREGDDFDPTAMQDEMLEFTQCMRDHGIDMPDPDFDEEGRPEPGEFSRGTVPDGGASSGPVLAGPFGVLDLSDPETEEAFNACSEGTVFGVAPGEAPARRQERD